MDLEMDKLVSLCKRRGFIFPSSEIYGGINGFWDYGPLGVELKRNIKEAWWRDNVQMRDDMVGLDCSIIMNPRVWEASGHVGGFSDPMVDCKNTKERYRADQLYVFAYVFPAVNHKGEPAEAWLAGLGGSPGEAASLPEKKAAKLAKKLGQPTAPPTIIPYMQLDLADRDKVIGPSTDERGTLTEPRSFNLMFKTFVGALENESNIAYLRPETAQGIFANFKNVVDTGRVKLPFGIAQVGKSFRNEINPRNFTFRSREFEQMEIEFFCRPEEAKEWYAYWRKARFQWYVDLGLQIGSAAAARPRRRGACLLLDGHGGHRVRLPVRHQRAGRDRPSGRLRPHPAHEVQRQGPQLFRRGAQGAVRAARRRAVGRRRPRDAGLPVRGLHRGPGGRRDPHGAQVPSPDRADQGRDLPAGQA